MNTTTVRSDIFGRLIPDLVLIYNFSSILWLLYVSNSFSWLSFFPNFLTDEKHNLRGSRFIEERTDIGRHDSPEIPVEWEGKEMVAH